jgi:predicted anti-sigma-YlaC factor YlaD
MSCASFEELLLDYADLPAQERDAVDLHLTQCASCRQYSDTLLQLDVALTEQFSGVQPSELFHSRLHATTSRSPQARLKAPSFLPELLDLIGVAGIVLVLSLVLWKLGPIPEITDFVPIVGIVLPVSAGLVLFGIAWLGARVYAEFKS